MLFQNFLFVKEFLACNGYFWLLKMGLGIAFVAHFLHDFSIKIIFIYSINGQSFNVCFNVSFVPSQDIKQNVLFKFLFRQL